jgi:hypothetical protein
MKGTRQMAKTRKTINVDWLREHVNMMLKTSTCDDEIRKGFCAVLECALHKANRYRGFSHIEWINGGCDAWVKAGKPEFPEKYKYIGNDTRRYYI